MQMGETLRKLADLVDDIEATGVDVVEARPDGAGDDGDCIAELRVRVPAEADGNEEPALATGGSEPVEPPEATPEGDTAPETTDGPDGLRTDRTDDADVASAGTVEPEQGATEVEADADDGAEAEAETDDETDVEPGSPDRVECTRDGCEAAFDTEHGMRIHRSKAHGPAGPDYDSGDLRTVYERHDSFEAMRDALDADVSAQTVRRWMMDRGIHTLDGSGGGSEERDAESADAGRTSERDDETEPAGSDGVRNEDGADPESELGGGAEARYPDLDEELPDGVTAEALRAAVEAADTLYDVQNRLDLDRETARDVLSAFDLLELVHGRVADQDRREELKDEIDVRIEANASTVDSRS